MIGIIDYDTGNIRSVENALKRLGAEYVLSDRPEVLDGCERLILPGVGEAAFAMKKLIDRHLDGYVRGCSRPVLGICLGMQLLCAHSEEGDVDCLGVFENRVRRFPEGLTAGTGFVAGSGAGSVAGLGTGAWCSGLTGSVESAGVGGSGAGSAAASGAAARVALSDESAGLVAAGSAGMVGSGPVGSAAASGAAARVALSDESAGLVAAGSAGMVGSGPAGSAAASGAAARVALSDESAGLVAAGSAGMVGSGPVGSAAASVGLRLKVPQVGWNDIRSLEPELYADVPEGSFVYFVHSYYAEINENTASVTEYGIPFSSSLRRGNFMGCQFHPEKSGDVGERIIRNFLKI